MNGRRYNFGNWLLWIGIGIIILNGLKLNFFEVDGNTILIYFILNITFSAIYFGGARKKTEKLIFKSEIKEAKELVEQAVAKAKRPNSAVAKTKGLSFATLKLDQVNELLKTDAALALAVLSIEVEKRVDLAKTF